MIKVTKMLLVAGLVAVAAFAGLSFKPKKALAPAGNQGFALVELYTSEGCSSCPPADALLEKIQQQYHNQNVYVLSYHVDYWNRLGWKDTFSAPAYSDRQRNYARYLPNADGVYTPQAIVNGAKEFIGSDEGAMNSAVKAALASPGTVNLELDKLTADVHTVQITYRVSHNLPQNTSLNLVLVQKKALTNVKAGENAGKALAHVNVVRSLKSIVLNGQSQQGTASVALPEGMGMDNWAITGFIQNNANGRILAATNVNNLTTKPL